jgi:ribonuclease HII
LFGTVLSEGEGRQGNGEWSFIKKPKRAKITVIPFCFVRLLLILELLGWKLCFSFVYRAPFKRSYHHFALASMPKIQSRATKLLSTSLTREAEHQARGQFLHVIGADEAGRGPLAGPVVAAACYIPSHLPLIPGIKDSKLLNEAEREEAYEVLIKLPEIVYDVSIISHEEIDRINILQASMLGMSNATRGVIAKLRAMKMNPVSPPGSATTTTAKSKKGKKTTNKTVVENNSNGIANNDNAVEWESTFIGLVDGNHTPKDYPLVSVKPIIQGDRKIYSIAAASILAKVTRDRLMVELHEKYPIYNFQQHKGYPTAAHRAILFQHGPCEIHRRTYGPVKVAIEKFEKKIPLVTTVVVEKAGGVEKKENKKKATKKADKTAKVTKEEIIIQTESVIAKSKKSTIQESKKNTTSASHSSTEEPLVAEKLKRGRKRKVEEEPLNVTVITTAVKMDLSVPAMKKSRKSVKEEITAPKLETTAKEPENPPRRNSPRFL